MKNRITLFVLLSFLLSLTYACKENTERPKFRPIQGLASPVNMQSDKTKVFLSDYVDPGFSVDSIKGDQNLNIDFNKEQNEVYLTDNGKLPYFSFLNIFIAGEQFSIPLYKSRKKKIDFSYTPKNTLKSLGIAGDMNAWDPANTPFSFEEGSWQTELYLLPGEYQYQLVINGERALDDNNPLTIAGKAGGTNSLLIVEGVEEKELPAISLINHNNKELSFLADRSSAVFAAWDNLEIQASEHAGHFDIAVPEAAKHIKRSYIRIWASNDLGRTNYTKIPLHYGNVISNAAQLDRSDFEKNIMYNVFVDRFNNGDTSNDFTVPDDSIHPRANYHGGDIAGVIEKIEGGYFQKLGINNIWLSPIVQNPDGAFGYYNNGGVISKFAGYHGYWPISFTQVNPHFGNSEDVKQLVKAAHDREINMFLDFIANHVHEDHPVYQANKDNEWATNLYLPDGSLNTERWDEHRLTTWFDVFMPSLNLQKQEITEMLSDSAVFWLEEYQFDGFRHDATKHIPLNFWRTLTAKVKKYQKESDALVMQLGETYGTPELINSYISSGMLNGQFDFNVYDDLSTSIILEDLSLQTAVNRIKQSQDYYGTNHLMGNITGNQDRSRFMSHASGEVRFDEDTKLAGWTRDINFRPKKAFDQLAILHAVNMTIPGIPVIYYGDEIGFTGGNDPDNRRMMRFENWNEDEKSLFETVASLTNLRQNKMSLLFGNMDFLKVENDVLVYSRRYFTENVIIVINNSSSTKNIESQLPDELIIDDLKSLNNTSFNIEDRILTIELAPYSFELIHN